MQTTRKKNGGEGKSGAFTRQTGPDNNPPHEVASITSITAVGGGGGGGSEGGGGGEGEGANS